MLLAKFGFDTAENEPSKVWPIERCREVDEAPRGLRFSERGGSVTTTRARAEVGEGTTPRLNYAAEGNDALCRAMTSLKSFSCM